jgi:hypothetical protein
MQKIALVLITLTAVAAPAEGQDNFIPRLLAAKHDYLEALEVCLRRVIAESPVAGAKPEHTATTAIKTCQKRDAAVRAKRKRVYGFPSVDNFMAGTDERISAFSLRLATAHMGTKGLR